MGAYVYQVSVVEKVFDQFVRQSTLGFVFFLSLVSTWSPNTHQQQPFRTQQEALVIGFDHFSPAFAAYEDEFLFHDEEKVEHTEWLEAGSNHRAFVLTQERIEDRQRSEKRNDFENQRAQFQMSHFDGSVQKSELPRKIKSLKKQKTPAQATGLKPSKAPQDRYRDEGELRFGPLIAARPSQPAKKSYAQSMQAIGSLAKGPLSQQAPQVVQKAKAAKEPTESFEQLAHYEMPEKEWEKTQRHSSYSLQGGITLSEGLAYFGTLEVTWVLGDEVQAIGSVNVPDATYEIQTQELLGEIIVSLYDNSDHLIGEGLVDLAELRGRGDQIEHNIDIRPINWNLAGHIVHVHSLGAGSEGAAAPLQPISDAEVHLYGLNLASTSLQDGRFEIENWKKANSRSLAIAGKTGYRDSIFLLDSRREAKVPLLSESYLHAFFQTLEDQGLYNRENQGMVYGSLQGIANLSGYQVRLRDEKAIYFNNINIAKLDQAATADNGLFAFVGLDDGDYELTLEKNGEVVDHRILVVEQGKVTPVIIDLKTIYKHVQFYDPMQPELALGAVDISFFDGVEHHKLDKQQRLKAPLPGGNEPNMIEFSVGGDVARSFISRQRGLERLPLMAGEKLQKLAQANEMTVETGLIYGFVETAQFYEVDLAEGTPAQIIYFNDKGQQINPHKDIPFGFIMGGFYQGLNTLIIRNLNGENLASDLIFSDHTSISVVNTFIHELN